MKAQVFDQKGVKKSEKSLEKAIFEVKVDEKILKDSVLRYLNNKREATSKTKTRAERSGGGKKPWRQKGTGRARTGSIRNPIWRKGGVTFGPTGEESFKTKMNKRVIRQALKMALSKKARDERVLLVDKIEMIVPKTKDLNKLIKKLPVQKRILIISDENPALFKASENLPKVFFSLYNQLNPYYILISDYLVFTEAGYKKAVDMYKRDDRYTKKAKIQKKPILSDTDKSEGVKKGVSAKKPAKNSKKEVKK